MVIEESIRAATRRMEAAIAEGRFGMLLRALERRYRPDQPRVPAGTPEGGQWTNSGSDAGRRQVALAGWLIGQRVGVVYDRLIRMCTYEDFYGRQYSREFDATEACPRTLAVPPQYGPM